MASLSLVLGVMLPFAVALHPQVVLGITEISSLLSKVQWHPHERVEECTPPIQSMTAVLVRFLHRGADGAAQQ